MKTEPLLKKVLIAEDRPELQDIFIKSFDRRHFIVRVAVDGIDLMERLQPQLPDVLILDINMRGVSSFNVLRYVRQKQKAETPKVILVAGRSMALKSQNPNYGDLFLLRPVNVLDLAILAQGLMP